MNIKNIFGSGGAKKTHARIPKKYSFKEEVVNILSRTLTGSCDWVEKRPLVIITFFTAFGWILFKSIPTL